MPQIIHIDFTVFRFVVSVILLLIAIGGSLIAVGRLLNKQKGHCNSLKILNNALWKEGRPLLQSVGDCKESRKEVQEDLDSKYDVIIKKLEDMDKKRAEVVIARNAQIAKINKHVQRIELLYVRRFGSKAEMRDLL